MTTILVACPVLTPSLQDDSLHSLPRVDLLCNGRYIYIACSIVQIPSKGPSSICIQLLDKEVYYYAGWPHREGGHHY